MYACNGWNDFSITKVNQKVNKIIEIIKPIGNLLHLDITLYSTQYYYLISRFIFSKYCRIQHIF